MCQYYFSQNILDNALIMCYNTPEDTNFYMMRRCWYAVTQDAEKT